LATLLLQLIEEVSQRLTTLPMTHPHDPPRLVVDHDGQVTVSFAVAELVDTDLAEIVESSGHPVVLIRLPSAAPTAGSTPAGNDVHHQTAFPEVRVPHDKLRDTNQPTQ